MQHVFPGESKGCQGCVQSKTLPDYRSAVASSFPPAPLTAIRFLAYNYVNCFMFIKLRKL